MERLRPGGGTILQGTPQAALLSTALAATAHPKTPRIPIAARAPKSGVLSLAFADRQLTPYINLNKYSPVEEKCEPALAFRPGVAIDDVAQDGQERNAHSGALYGKRREYVASTLIDSMERRVRQRKGMPKTPRVIRRVGDVARNSHSGNLLGRIGPSRPHGPTPEYLTEQAIPCGLGLDSKVRYTKEELRENYGSFEHGLSQSEAVKNASVVEGYLLSEDSANLLPIAKPENF